VSKIVFISTVILSRSIFLLVMFKVYPSIYTYIRFSFRCCASGGEIPHLGAFPRNGANPAALSIDLIPSTVGNDLKEQ